MERFPLPHHTQLFLTVVTNEVYYNSMDCQHSGTRVVLPLHLLDGVWRCFWKEGKAKQGKKKKVSQGHVGQ